MKTKTVLTVLLTFGIAVANLFAAPKEGDLVQGSSDAIYLIRDGQRCGIPSAEVFLELGYKWDKIIKISAAELNAIPEGPVLTTLVKPNKTTKEGDLVQGSNAAVYVIQSGKRCAIPNPDVFKARGYKPEQIVKLTDADLNAIPKGPAVTMPYTKPKDGDLIKAGSDAVYVIQSGERCVIPSMEILKAKGYKPEKIISISDAEMEAISEGPAVE